MLFFAYIAFAVNSYGRYIQQTGNYKTNSNGVKLQNMTNMDKK